MNQHVISEEELDTTWFTIRRARTKAGIVADTYILLRALIRVGDKRGTHEVRKRIVAMCLAGGQR